MTDNPDSGCSQALNEARSELETLRTDIHALRSENGTLAQKLSELAHARANSETHRRASSVGPFDHLDAVRYLVMAAEFKDHDTGAHLVRIGYLSALLAPACGCDDDFSRLILHASTVHDVGKIGIPDHILKKQSPLTLEEREVMHRHAEYGAKILSGSDFPVLNLAAEIALTHHECYDGCGYPRGLRGNMIPLSGRIVAVVDVFDALAMDRSYRAAIQVEKAFDVLRQGRGRHFDPDVVDAFFDIADDVLALRERINSGERTGAIGGRGRQLDRNPFEFYDGTLISTPPVDGRYRGPVQ